MCRVVQPDASLYTRYRIPLVPVCLPLILAGCAGGISEQASVQPITSNSEALAQVDLITLLDPERKAKRSANEQESLEAALHAFYQYTAPSQEPDENEKFLTRRRNSVQDRLIAASNFECGRYKTRLLHIQSSANFGLSTLSTGLGAAGAIVSGGASQILSGAAAFTNATRSAFNENYFRQLAIETITRSIDARRTELVAEITERRGLTIAQYTVAFAIGDALKYHNQCTLVAGLEFANDAVSFANDPPIRRTINQLRNSGIDGKLTLDPNNARTVQGALTHELRTAGQDVPPEPPPPEEEKVEGAETETEKSLSVDMARRLQLKLCFKGSAIDAHLGPNTRLAIGQFQDDNNILGDGVLRTFLDPRTFAEISKLPNCPPQFFSYYESRAYANEDDRKALLEELGVNPELSLDNKQVRDAIKGKQKELGLPETGIIDSQDTDDKIFPPTDAAG